MENKYLEKIAGFAARLQGTETGKAMGDLSHTTNKGVLAALGSDSKMHAVNTGDKTSKWGLTGKKMVNAGKTRMTGDSLAANTVQDRLAAKKTAAGNAAAMGKAHSANAAAQAAHDAKIGRTSGGAKGILQKAVGMAKAKPLAAAGIGLGAAALGAAAMGRKKPDNQQGYYQ